MFIQKIHKKTKTKTYTSVVLMENYREGKKVKHRIISNLSKWPDELVAGLDKLLKGQKINSVSDLEPSIGKSFGGILTVLEISKRLGIKQALGNTPNASLALFQIAGRVISQGSRNYLANQWSKGQAVEKIFGLKKITEDQLYSNLVWLSGNQQKIEQKIYRYRCKNKPVKEMFLYDVTSSYLEGDKNELAAYGYNRDKKKGKKQIVIGLLTDSQGYPLSVEVFKGNTGDTKTVTNQLDKLKKNFGVERVIFVGDKGMVKSGQIKEIISDEYKWNYLTTITKEQIRTLLNKDIIQLELFDEDIVEVKQEDGIRYILRRNPIRAEETRENRESKINYIEEYLKEKNLYLKEHKRAKPEVSLRKIKEKIIKLKLEKILSAELVNRNILIKTDSDNKKKAEELDGCYVVKTDVPEEKLDAKTAHDRYKDLQKVEFAFRTMKTTLEKIRPIYVRKAEQTRGHVFVAMLAYMIIKYITDKLAGLNYTRQFIIESLDKIQYLEYHYKNKTVEIIPHKFLPHQTRIIEGLDIKINRKTRA